MTKGVEEEGRESSEKRKTKSLFRFERASKDQLNILKKNDVWKGGEEAGSTSSSREEPGLRLVQADGKPYEEKADASEKLSEKERKGRLCGREKFVGGESHSTDRYRGTPLEIGRRAVGSGRDGGCVYAIY